MLYKEEKARDLVWASCSSEADEFQLLKLDEAEQSKKKTFVKWNYENWKLICFSSSLISAQEAVGGGQACSFTRSQHLVLS